MRSATKKRIGKDPLYLAWIHTLPCVICAQHSQNEFRAEPWTQLLPTEAAHLGPHGLSQKVPDRRVVPLCAFHHRADVNSVSSLHALKPATFWIMHSLDPEKIITELNERFDRGERAA
jgi:hypothetical protein